MVDISNLSSEFQGRYGVAPRVFRAPGRVNLIGEHTDYNDGFVLPIAIDRDTLAAIAPRNDRLVRVYSVNLDEFVEFDLDADFSFVKGYWLNYVEGVARILEEKGFRLSGSDVVLWSDLPTGAGLSSSAALEIACALAFSKVSGHDIEKTRLAYIGQEAEHRFVGARCGIMDQFASANAAEGHALLLDCRTLELQNIPLDLTDFALVVCNTNIKHDLADSGYNTRRAECEEAVERLRLHSPEKSTLRDVTLAELTRLQSELPTNVISRARHVISENERTLKAAEALKRNDLECFGKLMFESHISLKDDFEVSCYELDLLVEIASECQGVLGARMTGGGFGGSTINIVRRENVNGLCQQISSAYFAETNLPPTVTTVESNDGASELSSSSISSCGT